MKEKQYNYIAVDFDGTLCEHKFPDFGEPKPKIIEWVREHAARGSLIILHTCREYDEGGVDYLTPAINWCAEHGVPIHAVNENPWVPFGVRKIYADIYVDDRAVNIREIEGGE